VVATSASESDDALPRALENEAILELAWAPKLTRSLEGKVDDSEGVERTPQVDLKNLHRPGTNRAVALLCDRAVHIDASGEPA